MWQEEAGRLHKHFQEGAEARAPAWLLEQTDFQVKTGFKILSHVFLGKRHGSQAKSGQLPESQQTGPLLSSRTVWRCQGMDLVENIP